jgi:hypothetical protein
MSHFSTPERSRDPSCVLPDARTWVCRVTDICRLRTPGLEAHRSAGPARVRASHLLTTRAAFLNRPPPRPFTGLAPDPAGRWRLGSPRCFQEDVEEERCTVYSQLSSRSPCCSAQAKRPARSGQSRSSIAVRTPPFRRKHRSGRCPVEAQGPTVPATENRLSAPKRLFRTSAGDALPELADLVATAWMNDAARLGKLPSRASSATVGGITWR